MSFNEQPVKFSKEIVEINGRKFEKIVCDKSTTVYHPIEEPKKRGRPRKEHAEHASDESKPDIG